MLGRIDTTGWDAFAQDVNSNGRAIKDGDRSPARADQVGPVEREDGGGAHPDKRHAPTRHGEIPFPLRPSATDQSGRRGIKEIERQERSQRGGEGIQGPGFRESAVGPGVERSRPAAEQARKPEESLERADGRIEGPPVGIGPRRRQNEEAQATPDQCVIRACGIFSTVR